MRCSCLFPIVRLCYNILLISAPESLLRHATKIEKIKSLFERRSHILILIASGPPPILILSLLLFGLGVLTWTSSKIAWGVVIFLKQLYLWDVQARTKSFLHVHWLLGHMLPHKIGISQRMRGYYVYQPTAGGAICRHVAYLISSSLAVGGHCWDFLGTPNISHSAKFCEYSDFVSKKLLLYLDLRPAKAPPKIIFQDCWHVLMVHMKYILAKTNRSRS